MQGIWIEEHHSTSRSLISVTPGRLSNKPSKLFIRVATKTPDIRSRMLRLKGIESGKPLRLVLDEHKMLKSWHDVEGTPGRPGQRFFFKSDGFAFKKPTGHPFERDAAAPGKSVNIPKIKMRMAERVRIAAQVVVDCI